MNKKNIFVNAEINYIRTMKMTNFQRDIRLQLIKRIKCQKDFSSFEEVINALREQAKEPS